MASPPPCSILLPLKHVRLDWWVVHAFNQLNTYVLEEICKQVKPYVFTWLRVYMFTRVMFTCLQVSARIHVTDVNATTIHSKYAKILVLLSCYAVFLRKNGLL